jgi:hypothetical protein
VGGLVPSDLKKLQLFFEKKSKKNRKCQKRLPQVNNRSNLRPPRRCAPGRALRALWPSVSIFFFGFFVVD